MLELEIYSQYHKAKSCLQFCQTIHHRSHIQGPCKSWFCLQWPALKSNVLKEKKNQQFRLANTLSQISEVVAS